MAWSPPHDDCGSCRFFRRSRPRTLCTLCGAGEFFEERTPDNEPTADELMQIHIRMFDEGHIPTESEINAVTDKDDDDDDRTE